MSAKAREIAAKPVEIDPRIIIVEARCGTFDAIAGRRLVGRFASAQAALQAAILADGLHG